MAALKPLDVSSDLTLELQGQRALRLHGSRGLLRAEVPSLRTVLLLWRGAPNGGSSPRQALSRLATALTHIELQVEVRVRGTVIGRAGYGVRPSLLAQMAGLTDVQLLPLAFLRTAFRL